MDRTGLSILFKGGSASPENQRQEQPIKDFIAPETNAQLQRGNGGLPDERLTDCAIQADRRDLRTTPTAGNDRPVQAWNYSYVSSSSFAHPLRKATRAAWVRLLTCNLR